VATHAITVPGALDLRIIRQDRTDGKFFIAAVEGNADYIVTKEQRWKKPKTYQGIRIVGPSKFYEILKKRKYSLNKGVEFYDRPLHQLRGDSLAESLLAGLGAAI
jgi:hypothetical protein